MQEFKRTLLVVDDDEAFLRGFARRWAHLARILTARDAASAVEIAAREKLELAVVDVHLGTTIGIDLVHLLKKTDPQLHVVLVSADLTTRVQFAAIEAGAYASVDKVAVGTAIVSLLDGTWTEDPTRSDRLEVVIRAHAVQMVARCGGNHTEAARALGIARSTLDRYLGYGRRS